MKWTARLEAHAAKMRELTAGPIRKPKLSAALRGTTRKPRVCVCGKCRTCWHREYMRERRWMKYHLLAHYRLLPEQIVKQQAEQPAMQSLRVESERDARQTTQRPVADL